jgi:P27 family predicted phage terminase small subunit
MGRRGAKPQPTALRVLRGNPGKRAADLNPDEPQHPPLDAAQVPDEIAGNEIARKEWQRIAPGLVACGHVRVTDRAMLIGYCLKYAHWQEQEQLAQQMPFLLKTDHTTIVHPAVKIANQTFLIVLRAAAEIGLTPSSRSRIVAQPPAAPVSKWQGALK